MIKKPKSYNLSIHVVSKVHDLAKEDERTDSDWLNRFLHTSLCEEPPTSKPPKAIAVKRSSTKFVPPTSQEVNKYAFEKKLNLKGFFHYYESNGWKVGNNKMKKWKSAAAGWSGKQYKSSKSDNPDFDDNSTDWVNKQGDVIT